MARKKKLKKAARFKDDLFLCIQLTWSKHSTEDEVFGIESNRQTYPVSHVIYP